MARDIADIRSGLAGLGLTPSDDSLDAMLALIGQHRPELLIWAYTGAKGHSEYFAVRDLTIPLEEFESLLDRAGLELVGRELCDDRTDIQQKGWPPEEHFDRFLEEARRTQGISADYSMGLWLDIPECCARQYALSITDAEKRFYADHPIGGYTESRAWLRSGIAGLEGEEREKRLDELFAVLTAHSREHGFYTGYLASWNSLKPTLHGRIAAGEAPESAYLLTANYGPCSPDCGAFIGQAERMHRSLAVFLGEERANEIVSDYRHAKWCA